MNERLIALPLIVKDGVGVVATDAVAGVKVPFPCLLVGASVTLDFVSGSPTAVSVDINDDTTAITGFADIALGATAALGAHIKTVHMGGTVAVPALIAADSVIGLDLKFTDGSTPKANITAILWILPSEG